MKNFRDFLEEGEVVAFPLQNIKSTLQHLRDHYGSDDDFNVETHWSDKLHKTESNNFSAYANRSGQSHDQVVDDVVRKATDRGGLIHKVYGATNSPSDRKTTTVEFKDRNGKLTHVAVRTYHFDGLSHSRHEIHASQDQ